MQSTKDVVIIGGGAVMDTVGLAAALVHRGLRQVRVPTTVLGQNDARVGVENGVNLLGGKNAIGTFAPPFAVDRFANEPPRHLADEFVLARHDPQVRSAILQRRPQ